jgi:hypothetical protein
MSKEQKRRDAWSLFYESVLKPDHELRQLGVWGMNSQLAWFALFAVALYFIISDESIAAAFYYVLELGNAYIKNPVVKYIMWRRNMKLAKQLQKYFDEKNK